MKNKIFSKIDFVMLKQALCITLICFGYISGMSQKAINKEISLQFENKTLAQVLYQVSTAYDIPFYFIPESLPTYTLSGSFENELLFKVFNKLNDGTRLVVIPFQDKGLFIVDRTKVTEDYLKDIYQQWQNGNYKYPFVIDEEEVKYTFGDASSNLQNVELILNVFDKANQDKIIGAVIRNEDFSISGASDIDGIIKLTLPSGTHNLHLSFTGYQNIKMDLTIYENASLDLPMSFQSVVFDEIEVVANSIKNQVEEVELGKEVISIKKLESIPQALGELDIIKSLEVLPGVSSAGELSVGFNVRGGNIDQSLVLFNDGIIFNPTHIVGFISAFNADLLDNATLYKAYVDPAFGGRGSGVLNLRADASNANALKVKGGLGTSLIKAMVEGPISPKLRFHVGARGSFNDYLLGLVANIEVQNSNANFSDLNLGFSYDLNDNHELLLNAYSSSDLFEYNDEFGFKWKNQHLGLKWKGKWSPKIYSNVSLNYGTYENENFTVNIPEASNLTTGINYLKGNTDLKIDLGNDNNLQLGLEAIQYYNEDEQLLPREESTLVPISNRRPAGQSLASFISWKQNLGSQLSFDLGFRFAAYATTGPGNIYEYSGGILEEENIESQTFFTGKDNQANYGVLEPRAALNFKWTPDLSLKLSYNRMSQNIFQISNTNTILPSATWAFTNRYLKPLIVDQASVGLYKLFDKSKSSLSVDAFYKQFKQNYVLKDFAQIFLNDHIETELVLTKGRSYGLEFLYQKQKGKWTGSVAYTFSRSIRQSVDPSKTINLDEEFPADFDIPHQLNLLASYQWLPVVSVNIAYIYKSGTPTTVPNGTIIQDGIVVPLYSFRNKGTIPHYSRLDLAFTLDLREAKQSGVRNSFTLGFYNLLGRRNPSNIFFRRSALGNIIPFQFAVVGATIPTLSWNFVY